MFERRVRFGFAALIFSAAWVTGPARGQPAGGEAAAPDLGTSSGMLEARLSFVRDLYQPSAEQLATITMALKEMLPDQEAYEAQTGTSVRRMRLSLSIAAADAAMKPETKSELQRRFEGQVRRVWSKAPLGLTNVIMKVEPLLSKQQVDAARQKMTLKAGPLLGQTGGKLDLSKAEILFPDPVSPIKPPEVQRRTAPPPVATNPPVHPVNPANPNVPQNPPVNPNTTAEKPTTPPITPTPIVPAMPERVVSPAPPRDTWRKSFDEAMAKYKLTDAQKPIAEAVFKSVQSRAEAHMAARAAELDAASKMPEGAERTAKLAELNRPMDLLFDEMNQRVNSIASVEQRLAASGTAPPPVPAKPVGTPTSAPTGHEGHGH